MSWTRSGKGKKAALSEVLDGITAEGLSADEARQLGMAKRAARYLADTLETADGQALAISVGGHHGEASSAYANVNVVPEDVTQ